MPGRVLVIDDEEDIRSLIAMILEEAGYEMLFAVNGEDGLHLLVDHGADLVILDVMMPGLTGWEICERIKSDPRYTAVPVLILTVRSMLRDQEIAQCTRADGFLNKPFEINELLEATARLIAGSSLPSAR